MIHDKMYFPSAQTLGDVELTNEIDSIANPHANIAEGYCMGYVTHEHMPDAFKLNFCSLPNAGDTTITFYKPEPANYSWGFVYERVFSNYSSTATTMYYRDSNNNVTRFSGFDYYQTANFVNAAQMCKATYPDGLQISCRYMFVLNSNFSDGYNMGADDNVNNVYINHIYQTTLTYLQMKTIIENNSTFVTITDTLAGSTISVDINVNDFNEHGLAIKTVNETYSIALIIYGWNANYYNQYSGWSGDSGRIPILPFFLESIPANMPNYWNIPEQNNVIVIPSGYSNEYKIRWRNGSIYDSNASIALGGWNYDEFNPIEAESHGLDYTVNCIYKNKIYIICGWDGMNRAKLYPQFLPTDLFKIFQFFNKIESGVTNWGDVINSSTYTTSHSTALFETTNNPTGERVTGNYQSIVSQLQPWQLENINITVSVYNPADLPPYDPTPGGGGENVGDNVIRPSTLGIGGTNGFVTQYALRATDIQELGQILWTSVFDSDYWQNYMFSLALDTGSFSMSSLLSFFVSLKVYPFALLNVPSYSQIGKNMYVGTGIHALEFTNNLHTINNYCDYIPGGSCTVWSGYFFNDYRDYINATYTLYVPYCGTIELNPGDVVHSTLTVQYAVDFATGGCVAYVDVLTHDGAQFTIAALPGQMGADVPLTATAAGAVASRFIGDAMKFGGLISGEVGNVVGGIAAGMSGKTPTGGGYGNVLSGMAGIMGGLPAAVGMDLAPGFAMQAANMIARGAVAAPMMSGGQGFASFGAPQTPYIQIRRGIYPDVTGLSTVCGSRGAGTYTIGELSGFVQGDIKTDGLNCPENEKIQIRQLIAKGIYV